MITKFNLQQFLNRKRKDWRPYKKLPPEELERKRRALPIRPPIWSKLRQHQKVCFLLGAEQKRFFFLCDTGTGKTLLSIALAKYFELQGVKPFLILVPNKINKAEWAREIRKHSPEMKYCVLSGSSVHKWEQLQTTKALIVIETYVGLMRMVCTLVKNKKGKNKLKPYLPHMRQLLKIVHGLIMDESTFVQNHRKLPYRICRKISRTIDHVFALTGTPFGRDPIMLWGQMYLVDLGETLGKTLGLFREAFFTATENYWGGTEYAFKKSKWRDLNRMLANRSIRYVAKQSDLPAVVPVQKIVKLPIDAQAYYDKAEDALLAAHGNYQEMKNSFLRMRQISSGFVGYKDDEAGIRAQFEFPTNPKLEMLTSIVQSIRADRKIIVFHDFVFSGSVIARELEKLEIGHVRLHRKIKDGAPLLDQFVNDPRCRVFILSTAGAFGLNLQVAKYGIFYESPVSVIKRKQMQRRLERQESEHDKVFIYDLIVQGTADERILEFHEQGKDMFQAIIEGARL